MSAQAPRQEALWLLVIIHLAGRVDGITRLQKLAFLTGQWIEGIERLGFYDDWKAGPYGPFSPSLTDDTDLLSRMGEIRKETTQISLDAFMETFTILSLGATHAESIERAYPKLKEAIQKNIIEKYAKAPLMSLLHDVYYSFPQFTIRSEIAGEVFDPGKRGG